MKIIVLKGVLGDLTVTIEGWPAAPIVFTQGSNEGVALARLIEELRKVRFALEEFSKQPVLERREGSDV